MLLNNHIVIDQDCPDILFFLTTMRKLGIKTVSQASSFLNRIEDENVRVNGIRAYVLKKEFEHLLLLINSHYESEEYYHPL